MPGDGSPDEPEVSRFVERFAAVLTQAGIPRMPARVFAALQVSDAGRLSAGELARRLQASPAAISGSVRYLIGVGMVSRESEPGSRRHFYQIPAKVWDEVMRVQEQVLFRWTDLMREGVTLLGADTPAGARMAESVRYFEFMAEELRRMLARWQQQKS